MRPALRSSILVAAAGVGAAVALLVIGWDRAPSDLDAVAGELAAPIAAAAQATRERAAAIARLPRMGWAVATDEATVLDLTASELAFRAQPDEFIGVQQIDRRTRARTWLWRAGRRLTADVPPGAATHAAIVGDELLVASVAGVVPEARKSEIEGAVVVARGVALAPLRQALAAHEMAARLDVGGSEILLGSAAATARVLPLRLRDAPGELTLSILFPHSGASSLFLALASLVLGLSLGAAVLLAQRGLHAEARRTRALPRSQDTYVDFSTTERVRRL